VLTNLAGKSIQLLAQELNLPIPPPLTQIEELMISPVHILMQAWEVRGGQSKYTGHICCFVQDTPRLTQRIPTLPEDLDILVIHRKGVKIDELSAHHEFVLVPRDYMCRRGSSLTEASE
jgi:hypothetical protein